MDKGRMEAFSDGVIAIIITIMVLGITAPEGDGLSDLLGLLPAIAAYAVSFIGVGTYWNNHHHLLKLVNRVNGRMLWSNLAFLFVLSFFPLATDWMQKTGFAALPTTCYVIVNMLVSLTYMNLERVIRRDLSQSCPPNPANEREMERRAMVEKRSLVIALVFPSSHLALVALVIAFLLWIVPDLRIVRLLDFLAEEQE